MIHATNMNLPTLDPTYLTIVTHLLAGLAAGGAIGLERSFHGRPAGFRTHALVSMASSLLMMVTLYQGTWMPDGAADMIRTDPTRMAQGIMTGIGFLGAGVIVKEGLSVRGLTTAASIWITAAIGILAGVGFYFPLVVSVVLTIVMLSVFRWIEALMPTQAYYHFEVRFARGSDITEAALRTLLEGHGFSIAHFSYRFDAQDRVRRHGMVLRTSDRTSAARLSERLEASDAVVEYRITPFGD